MPRHDEIADEGLRAMLQQVHDQMRGGDATEAVRTCTAAFLAMTEQHPELIGAKVAARGGEQPMVMLWPRLGANLSEDSVSAGKLEITFERPDVVQCRALLAPVHIELTRKGHQFVFIAGSRRISNFAEPNAGCRRPVS